MTFKLTSRDLQDGGKLPRAQVFNGMGHSGANSSPHLAWEGAPEGTQSFVVTVFDPDAPTGSGWWHWGVIDIPVGAHELPAGAGSGGADLPTGAKQTRTDFGAPGYGGAAPPPGAPHRYVFRIRAVGAPSLGLDEGASGAMVSAMSGMQSLGEATLTVYYP